MKTRYQIVGVFGSDTPYLSNPVYVSEKDALKEADRMKRTGEYRHISVHPVTCYRNDFNYIGKKTVVEGKA